MIGNSEELKLARELHMVMNTSISNWYVARFGNNPPGGDTLAWTVVIAMAMELVVLQQSKQWPMHKIDNVRMTEMAAKRIACCRLGNFFHMWRNWAVIAPI